MDVATLTGAMMLALGSRTFGIMSNDDDFRTAVHETAQEVGEEAWPMPLPEHLRKGMDSPTADIANMGERMGGGLVAGLFLKEFVGEGITWAHLDIAGPAFNEQGPFGYTPKGGTGSAVRTLVRARGADGRGRPRLTSRVPMRAAPELESSPGPPSWAPPRYALDEIRPALRRHDLRT